MRTLIRFPVRYRILGLLFVISFVNYLLRNNLSVAMPSIREEYGFTTAELGLILGGFNLSYTIFQIPGGVFGDVFGMRRALAAITLGWGVLTFLTGFAPALMAASAAGVLVSLVVVRFLLGLANAPMYPLAAGIIANWFPVGHWAFPNSICTVGLSLGQAAIGPLVTWMIVSQGWRESFYLLAPLGIAAAIWWQWYGRDRPAEHSAVSAQELATIDAGRPGRPVATSFDKAAFRKVLANRDVLLLAASYFCMNYVFYMFSQWLFTYLVEERGFSLLEGGIFYALPFVTGAVLAGVGGLICDARCGRVGPHRGCRMTAMTGLVLVAVFLMAGALAPNPYVAVAILSLCFGFTQFTDGAYWSATTYAAGPHAATATSVLNTGGNLPGFLAPLIGWAVDQHGWFPVLSSGSVFALAGAVLWLFVGRQYPANQ